VDEVATRLAPDVHYVCRSDSGASPFEEMVRADTRGRQDTMTWLIDHRRNSPYPLRHFGGNVFRVASTPVVVILVWSDGRRLLRETAAA
jgi:hypothetical protein